MDDVNSASVLQKVGANLAAMTAAPLSPGLYLVATPIGNLGDVTLRALAVLARTDLICCEDTRHSGILLHHFAIRTPTRAYHEHNAASERPRILAELAAGRRVALISDAGTPLISDPGFKLVREAASAGHPVVALPGPSSILAALVPSGLPTDAFFFAGFLPPKPTARRSRIADLTAVPGSLVFFEAPQRVADTLHDLAAGLGNRDGAVARELTKLHEEVARAPLQELATTFSAREPRGEVVIIVGPPLAVAADDDLIRKHLDAALQMASLRDAAKAVADALGVPKARVYDLGLKLRREKTHE